ncbi:hypothetical protein BJ165DRAFT_1404349 [Panaeolus papilionaceus]|nr:hypothetical protein BJ165DRAFT_1404349 [Panaeolus papilionaceus]
MKYFSPVIIISQLLLVTSFVQARHQRRYIDDASLNSREDILQSLTTRELVEELSARLERRTPGGLGDALGIVGDLAPPPLKIGLNLLGGLSHLGHHKHHTLCLRYIYCSNSRSFWDYMLMGNQTGWEFVVDSSSIQRTSVYRSVACLTSAGNSSSTGGTSINQHLVRVTFW